MKDFTREELQMITNKAVELAIEQGSLWKRVYEKLADAASTLDAFLARMEKIEKK